MSSIGDGGLCGTVHEDFGNKDIGRFRGWDEFFEMVKCVCSLEGSGEESADFAFYIEIAVVDVDEVTCAFGSYVDWIGIEYLRYEILYGRELKKYKK